MEVPRYWRLRQQRLNLIGQQCSHCDAKLFPPRDMCPICDGEAQQLINLIANDQDGDNTQLVVKIVANDL